MLVVHSKFEKCVEKINARYKTYNFSFLNKLFNNYYLKRLLKLKIKA